MLPSSYTMLTYSQIAEIVRDVVVDVAGVLADAVAVEAHRAMIAIVTLALGALHHYLESRTINFFIC